MQIQYTPIEIWRKREKISEGGGETGSCSQNKGSGETEEKSRAV